MMRSILWFLLVVLAFSLDWSRSQSNPPTSVVETAIPMSARGHSVMTISGANLPGSHTVIGSVPLVLGTATVTFTGNAAFTNSSSYQCTPSNLTALNFVRPTYNSGSSVTFTGVGTDTIGFICTGN